MTEENGRGNAVPEVPASSGWSTFEARIRGRRFARCIERASAALDSGDLDDARNAIEEARGLFPYAPEIPAFTQKILEASTAAPAIPEPAIEPAQVVAQAILSPETPGPEIPVIEQPELAPALEIADIPLQPAVPMSPTFLGQEMPSTFLAQELEPEPQRPGFFAVAAGLAALIVFGFGGFFMARHYLPSLDRTDETVVDTASATPAPAPAAAAPTATPSAAPTSGTVPTGEAAAPAATRVDEPPPAGTEEKPLAEPQVSAKPPAASSTRAATELPRTDNTRRPNQSPETSRATPPTAPLRASAFETPAAPRPWEITTPSTTPAAPSTPTPAPAAPATATPAPVTTEPARSPEPVVKADAPVAPPVATPAAAAPVAAAPTLPETTPAVATAARDTSVTPASRDTSAGSSRAADTVQIRTLLNRYESAFNKLDARAASDVWPGVNTGALDRAFKDLLSQRVSLGLCDITVIGDIGGASCAGKARWEPRVGGGMQTADRHWTFDLKKADSGWRIEQIRVR